MWRVDGLKATISIFSELVLKKVFCNYEIVVLNFSEIKKFEVFL